MRAFITFLHTLKFLTGTENPNALLTHSEITLVKRYANGCKRGVEIGVYEGFTTAEIAKSIDVNGILFAIDPFYKGRLGICWAEIIARVNLKREKVFHKVKFIKKLSHRAVNDIDNNINFCLIDGDHQLEAFRRDWDDYSPKIAKGGYIALHDTAFTPKINYTNFELINYFQKVIKCDGRFELVDGVDSLSIFKKIS